jgi:uncharacterized OB-fold protein
VACRLVHAPARRHRCLGCGSTRLSATRVELRGVFESWTRPPSVEAGEGEWALGLVKLDAGPMLTVRVRLNGVPPSVGARLAGRAERREGAPEQFWFEVLPARATAQENRAEARA